MPLVNFHSARVRDPGDFLDDDKAWATITIKPGIELVTAKLKKDGIGGPMTAQAYRFDIGKFTVQQAKGWLKKHKVKFILFEPAKPKEVKESTMVANIAARVTEKCFGSLFPKKKKKSGVAEQKGKLVVASDNPCDMKGSYENLRSMILKALEDSELYGKYPEILSTFPKKVFVAADRKGDKEYFMIDYTIQGDEVKLGVATPIEKQVKFVIKEMAEQCKSALYNPLLEAAWKTAYINDLPDSAFAYIESGGKKDETGKTVPRSLRHFPLKGSDGKYDSAHVINALQRLNQTTLSDSAKSTIKSKIKAGYRALKMQFPEEKKEQSGNPDRQALVSGIAIAALKGIFEGGPGSGNWGHKGRPGHRGGSAPRGSGVSAHVVKQGVHASTFYDKSGGLKVSEYKKLTDSQKESVLRHGVQKYKEQYVPKTRQGGMSAQALEVNKKVGALEGMRRAAINKAKGLSGKEARAALHIAISLQQRATQAAGSMKVAGAKVIGAGLTAIRTAERQPGR